MRAKTTKAKPLDGAKFLYDKYVAGDKVREQEFASEAARSELAGVIYEMRTECNLTQSELAKRIGTTKSVISRLEGADYRGHSLDMLKKIGSALGYRVNISFVSIALAHERKRKPDVKNVVLNQV